MSHLPPYNLRDNLVPNSYTKTELELDFLSEKVSERITENIADTNILSPLACDVKFLPVLGEFYSVFYWSEILNELGYRTLISKMIEIKKYRGTVWAVKEAVKSIDSGAVVFEGNQIFRYDGALKFDGVSQYGYTDMWNKYTVVPSKLLTIKEAWKLRLFCESVAPARCKLDRVDMLNSANNHGGVMKFDGAYSYGYA